MTTRNKLELTWVGKDEQIKVEPRILLEDSSKSYGTNNSGNMLIHGDNLLALKSLEQEFAGRIKCIYIDPPYNTGSRIDSDGEEIGYDDGIEHSEWLNMMRPRLELLKSLLHPEGSMFVQIDDNEFARLYLLLIEIFGERNLKTICIKMSQPTGVKMTHAIGKGRIPKLKEFIILARKNGIQDVWLEKIPKEDWDNEYKLLVNSVSREELSRLKEIIQDEELQSEEVFAEADRICTKFTLTNISDLFRPGMKEEEKLKIKYDNAYRIVRDVATSDGAKRIADEKLKSNEAGCFMIKTKEGKKYIIRSDYNKSSNQPRIKLLFADDYLTVHPGDFWDDIKTTGLDNEGGIKFKKGKKPEALLKRIIEATTKPGEYVLDSFAGSGTTGSVAHKMNRKWIMIEMANHAYSHIIPRVDNVIDGKDLQGITKAVNWQGGGGFNFYELASSLLTKDKYGNWIIDKNKYDSELLVKAICKLNGYTYNPDQEIFWKQGYSNENSYIYVTTQFINSKYLDQLSNELVGEDKLFICCSAYDIGLSERYENILLKQIPQSILDKFDYGIQNYNLNIVDSKDIFEGADYE